MECQHTAGRRFKGRESKMEEETIDATPPLSDALASRWRRLFGVIIDNLLSTLISLSILWYTGIFQQLQELLQEQQTMPMNYNLTFSSSV
jgi:hypothetical protein